MNRETKSYHFIPWHVGNGNDHSPDGKQVVSDGPFKPYFKRQENEARPPTSRDRIVT